MFVLVFPQPSRVYDVWHGRRALASLDALAWPAAWAWLVATQMPNGGLTTKWLLALLGCIACRRLMRAVWANEHYGFSTWKWGKVLIWCWLFGFCLKLLLLST